MATGIKNEAGVFNARYGIYNWVSPDDVILC